MQAGTPVPHDGIARGFQEPSAGPEFADRRNANLSRLDRQKALPAVGWLHFEVPAQFPVARGEEIAVRPMVRDVDNMFGRGFEVGFDPLSVEVSGVDTAGSILGDDLLRFTDVIIPGELPVGITRKRQSDGLLVGVSGSGVLATLYLTALHDLGSLDGLRLRFLDDVTLPRYTRADITEVRFQLDQQSAMQYGGSLTEGGWGQ